MFYPLVPLDVATERAKLRFVATGRLLSAANISTAHERARANLKKLFDDVDVMVVFDNTSKVPCAAEIVSCRHPFVEETVEKQKKQPLVCTWRSPWTSKTLGALYGSDFEFLSPNEEEEEQKW
jgi:predicted ABC-type ATPase